MKKISFFQHNWWAIFYFNFKMLPLKQAIKLPFDFYYSVRFESLKGKVLLHGEKIYRGMVKFGGRGSDMFPRTQTVINIDGRFEVGSKVEVGAGVVFVVKKNAICKFADKVRIGAMSKVFCEELISIGEEVGISWESQIFDTNFHYMKNIQTSKVCVKTSPVIIGRNNWFGNRVNIMKGTVIGDNMIIASNSLCSKSYMDIPPYSIIGGCPAKLLKNNIRRMFSEEELGINSLINKSLLGGGK